MKRLFEFIMHGCWHKWVPTSQAKWSSPYGGYGPCVYVRCEKCGHRKSFDNATIGEGEVISGGGNKAANLNTFQRRVKETPESLLAVVVYRR